MEFCVAWNAWDLLVIQCCLECLELAWDSGLLEMLGVCLEFKLLGMLNIDYMFWGPCGPGLPLILLSTGLEVSTSSALEVSTFSFVESPTQTTTGTRACR